MLSLSRRRVLQLTSASLALGLVDGGRSSIAQDGERAVSLKIESRTLDVDGKAARVFAIAQADGTPGLAGEKGKKFRVELVNQVGEESLIHWHGLTPPSEQDGVPLLSQPPLPPGQSYHYDFLHNRAGTFWMHSHVGLQEQQLMAAPLIVRDPSEPPADEQEVVILLHDFTFRDPWEILQELRGGMAMAAPGNAGHGGQMHGGQMQSEQMPGGQMPGGHGSGMAMTESGGGQTGQHGGMQMPETDPMGQPTANAPGAMAHVNDVDFDAYLANDRTLNDPEVVRVEPGARVRLRLINAAAASNFLLDLGAIEGALVAVDGNPVTPVRGQSFDLAIAQRVDVALRLPAGEGAYPILAQREDDVARTGIILATRNAPVRKVPGHAKHKARALNLALERRLSATSALPARPADRTLSVDMTGRHAGYFWGFDGKSYDPRDPLVVAAGERVEMVLRNRTAMPHPIHLHGHHFQMVAIDGARFLGAVRDTVLVPPQQSVTLAFDADNPGHWALHCHHLYHMAAGMMTSLKYEGYVGPAG